MGTVNVNRNVTDLFYRYKMPRISAKVEGKGNGIKTVIVNMAEVAKAIGRPATYPTKYFGCELGAQTQFDYKHERFIVNGSHDADKLQDLLDGFIRKYVLCPECDNPETDLKVQSKKGTISQTCKACGFHGPLTVHHKVNTFIIKNPPNINPSTQGSSLTEGKRSKRSKKVGENGENDGDTSVISNADDTLGQSTSIVDEDDDDNTTWSADVSEEAVRARMYDLTDGAKNIVISDDTEKPEKERMDIFYEFVKKRRDGNQLDNAQVQREIVVEAERLDITQKATLVLAELVFSKNIILETKKNRNLLLRFTHNNQKAQRYLMGGLELIISLNADTLLDKTAGILKLFYDTDILEEKTILEWSEKISKKYVSKEMSEKIHEKAKPFIQWLREADEESSEEEDDSDLEIEYNDRARVEPLRNEKPAPVAKKPARDEEADDIDIDDI